MKSRLLFVITFCGSAAIAQNNRVSITIDDLPCANCQSLEEMIYVNQKILKTLIDYQVPCTGFVNESKVYEGEKVHPEKATLLEQWVKQNFDLGNHTFSHVNINNTSLSQYRMDIQRGEIITRPLMKRYSKTLTYFRHTQLRTGPTIEYKQGLEAILNELGYKVAPVTIDNDEYLYAQAYRISKLNKDTAGMRLIAYDYLSYMENVIKYYEKASRDLTGRNINQILLIHANELNADYLDHLIQIFKNRDYTFVTLTEALTDNVYNLPDAQTTRGLSWIHRWQLAKGVQPSSHPETSEKIKVLTGQINSDKYSFTGQKLLGDPASIAALLTNIRNFSSYYINKDYQKMAECYTLDGKIFPDKADIIEGKEAIMKRWILPINQSVVTHVVTPVEISVMGSVAYDYGYFEGTTAYTDGKKSNWRGKYVIIWKKIDSDWKMYLDIWNRI